MCQVAAHLLYVGVYAAGGALLRGAWMTIVFLEHTITYRYTVCMGPKLLAKPLHVVLPSLFVFFFVCKSSKKKKMHYRTVTYV